MLGNQVIRARHGIISLADHPLALSNSLQNEVSNIHQQALSAYPRHQHKPRHVLLETLPEISCSPLQEHLQMMGKIKEKRFEQLRGPAYDPQIS